MALLSVSDLAFLGHGLQRPECVLAHSSGLLVAPDWTDGGGITLLTPDGRQARHLARDRADNPLRPNGIALEAGGNILIAHLGQEEGGVYRLRPDGCSEPVLVELDGKVLPPTNFVTRDHLGRLWVTVSTRVTPRAADYRATAATGFIVLLDDKGARIVADGLGYANECLLSPDGTRLYVNETFGRRLTAFDVTEDGVLTNRRCLVEFGDGTFPDGLALDEAGGIWIVSIVSNRVMRLTPDGKLETILEDSDPNHLNWVEAAYRSANMDRPHLDGVVSKRLRNISNLAFGGRDRRHAYLGCLLGQSIACFRSPFAGIAPPHWDLPLGQLASLLPTTGAADG
ncbi:SMP-30/gluconolactonase/LRE family protein [Limibacillus halophilus]|uniref:Sugar lactone lactonase YvrE n=1 Tax=Limibacillus halophilus TaxID=1579333 RepID=A0A839SUF9_9PROT|nr:SMP-30/gluconolactonase/LRE family protein [Limibacillus halophilus]MBB3064573.1 sugar lactone lactonase YvrE [Limibacillus halophilus]